ncbi:MAG: cytochrome d ubiquinol oxidase subunit II [Xanthobacteraceae bacterium]|nr:cytochrome d ubiquinol oxidase subunit II [Xanthobacteraceae bacterium]
MEWYLPLIWALVIGFAVAMYVVLDGFDLGIGILFPFAKEEAERDQMMNTVAPFWDGNETWLVLGGAGLLVAFPVAYAILMPAFYLPVTLMLLGLVLRGVSFEFRWIAKTSKYFWNFAFAGGSTVAAFMQGVIVGGMVSGVKVQGTQYAGGGFDWLTPFNLMCGLAMIAGYALLGATWLMMKTEGEVAKHARRQATIALYAVLFFMAVVSLWTPLAHPRIAERWFTLPNFLFFWPVPFVTAVISVLCWHWLRKGNDTMPFFCAIALFFMGYSGLVISNFPYLVPPVLTVWQTAAVPASQLFALMGTLFMFPILIGYTVFIYWIFRGKIREGEGYH